MDFISIGLLRQNTLIKPTNLYTDMRFSATKKAFEETLGQQNKSINKIHIELEEATTLNGGKDHIIYN